MLLILITTIGHTLFIVIVVIHARKKIQDSLAAEAPGDQTAERPATGRLFWSDECRRFDGSVRRGLSEGSPYNNNEGVSAGYAGSVTDITDRKQDEIQKNDFLAVTVMN